MPLDKPNHREGCDKYETEKLDSLKTLAERITHHVNLYKDMKAFAAKNGVDVSGIDLASDFATTGKFQQKNREQLDKAGDGRAYLGIVLSTLHNAVTDLWDRIEKTDAALKDAWRAEHPEYFNLPEHLL